MSVRELRTLLVKTVDLPLTVSKIDDFEKMLRQCGQLYNTSFPSVDPVEFETHYDPDLVCDIGLSLKCISLSLCLTLLFYSLWLLKTLLQTVQS